MERYQLTNLKILEADSIHVMREVAAEFERPVMLYSVGKDSSVMLHLARKAFHPGRIPFPLLHIDTSYKFPEMLEFRDRFCREIDADLVVYKPDEALAEGVNPWEQGTIRCCAQLKTQALLAALHAGRHDAAFGGARRDEERSRAKERIYSVRDSFGQWDPRNQRPELWNIYNARINQGESVRVFPLSNWTELDIWHYILLENIPVVGLYFAREHEILERDGQLIPIGSRTPLRPGEKPRKITCRFRTLGCYPCTGAVRSTATTIPEIIREMMVVRNSERVSRIIDHDMDCSMEEKKKEGYF